MWVVPFGSPYSPQTIGTSRTQSCTTEKKNYYFYYNLFKQASQRIASFQGPLGKAGTHFLGVWTARSLCVIMGRKKREKILESKPSDLALVN